MKPRYFIALSLFLSASAFAAMPKHSKLEMTTSSAKDQTVSTTFKIIPDKDMVINDGKDPKTKDPKAKEAKAPEKKDDNMGVPWQLSVKDAKGISFQSTELEFDKFEKNIPGFKLSSKPKAEKTWSYTFKMIAFVCTEKKENCYRDVFWGTCSADAKGTVCKETDAPKPTK